MARAKSKTSAGNGMARWARELGVLRWLLLIGVVITFVLAPAAGTSGSYTGWALVPSVLIPVIAPLLLMLLLLDALMSRVFMTDTHGDARRRLRMIVTLNLIVAAALVIYWIPYYLAL